MKMGVIISSNDAETAFNALRLANFSRKEGDDVRIFLLGKGVDLDQITDERFDIKGQAESFLDAGGEILACGTCLELRHSKGSEICPISTMQDLHRLIQESERLITI